MNLSKKLIAGFKASKPFRSNPRVKRFLVTAIIVHIVTFAFYPDPKDVLKTNENTPFVDTICIMLAGYGSIQLIKLWKAADRELKEKEGVRNC